MLVVCVEMSNQELIQAGNQRMDETDQAIERSKQVTFCIFQLFVSGCSYLRLIWYYIYVQVVHNTVEVGTQTAANLKGQVCACHCICWM